MANWYNKYLSIYGKSFDDVPQEIVDGTRERLAALQNSNPIASIVVIAYNDASLHRRVIEKISTDTDDTIEDIHVNEFSTHCGFFITEQNAMREQYRTATCFLAH